jgi:hypothetical protein
MSQSIRETVPKLLRMLWDLEKELRGAAQNTVVLRRDEAKRHLSDARRHLDALLGLARSADADPEQKFDDSSTPPSIKH